MSLIDTEYITHTGICADASQNMLSNITHARKHKAQAFNCPCVN